MLAAEAAAVAATIPGACGGACSCCSSSVGLTWKVRLSGPRACSVPQRVLLPGASSSRLHCSSPALPSLVLCMTRCLQASVAR